jgi:acetoin utilization protein AcuB
MIGPDKPVTEAQRLMVENGLYYLPVVGDGKRLHGMLTPPRMAIPPDRLGSLDVWEITKYLSALTVEKVMLKGRELRTIAPEATLEDAAAMMIQYGTGGLPVVENGIVCGLITDNDLLKELQLLLGATDPGWRVTVRVPNKRGEFLKLTVAISDKGWSIMAMGNVRVPKYPDRWDILLKIWGCTRVELVTLLEDIEELEIRDIREITSHVQML